MKLAFVIALVALICKRRYLPSSIVCITAKCVIFLLQCRPTQSRFLQSRNLNCVALCEGTGLFNYNIQTRNELFCHSPKMDVVIFLCTIPLKLTNFVFLSTVITSKDLQKHGNIWVCPISDHVCTRFFFVWVFSHFITLSYYKFCLFWLTMCPTIVCFSSGTRTAR